MRGERIVPTGGELEEDQYVMVDTIGGGEAVILHDGGRPTGIGCYLYKL